MAKNGSRRYRVLKPGNRLVWSRRPGRYAGNRTHRIFGRLDCRSGMLMRPENRVFFHTWADAIACGYRPCLNCRPAPERGQERKEP